MVVVTLEVAEEQSRKFWLELGPHQEQRRVAVAAAAGIRARCITTLRDKVLAGKAR